MTDPIEADSAEPNRGDGLDPTLSRIVARLRALRSAWSVLSPSGLSSEKSGIAVTGRALSEEIVAIARRDNARLSESESTRIRAGLDALETEMREVAFKAPVSQLRSTLPQCLSRDRRGVLDLLDLMLGADVLGLPGTEERIPSIDYLVTLLCASGDRGLGDPVHLTPRLNDLCERSSVDYDPRLPEIEAEFFAAADLYEADAREEVQLRELRRRKAELGSSYFAPQVLRAIVAYNASLLQRIDEEVVASQDWGSLPPLAADPIPTTSVFETPAIAEIAGALGRRVAGKTPDLSPIDRVAWCLDLEFLSESERQAVLGKTVGQRGDPTSTAIMVGLLSRSAVVLEEEFPLIGISPSLLKGEWVQELADTLQQEVNRRLAADEYQDACLLSELKNKFLYASMANVRRDPPVSNTP